MDALGGAAIIVLIWLPLWYLFGGRQPYTSAMLKAQGLAIFVLLMLDEHQLHKVLLAGALFYTGQIHERAMEREHDKRVSP